MSDFTSLTQEFLPFIYFLISLKRLKNTTSLFGDIKSDGIGHMIRLEFLIFPTRLRLCCNRL